MIFFKKIPAILRGILGLNCLLRHRMCKNQSVVKVSSLPDLTDCYADRGCHFTLMP